MKLIQSIVTDLDGDQVAAGIDIEVEKLMGNILAKEGIFVKELLIECEKEIGVEQILEPLEPETNQNSKQTFNEALNAKAISYGIWYLRPKEE